MMGELARAAMQAGARVIGIRPSVLDHLELPQAGIEMIPTPDLFERKQQMIARSDAFLILPGGLGTLDEFFEVVTTAQLGMHEPIVLVNTERYFDPLLALYKHVNAEGFIYGDVGRLFAVARCGRSSHADLRSSGLPPPTTSCLKRDQSQRRPHAAEGDRSTRLKASPKPNTASASVIEGEKYCRKPSVERRMRRAPAANMASGRAGSGRQG